MNRIHPTAIIGEGVTLGSDNVIGPYAVLLGPSVIGDGNWIGPHALVGAPGEVRGSNHGAAWDGDYVGTGIVIGDKNVLREYVTVHQGHYDQTVIGSDCFIMNRTEISHDSQVGDRVTIAPQVTLGGHAQIGSGANLGIGAVLHQYRVVGPGAMVGMGSVVTHNVPPFSKAYGNPCRVAGANLIGLERSGVTVDSIETLRAAYEEGREPDLDSLGAVLRDAWVWWAKATKP